MKIQNLILFLILISSISIVTSETTSSQQLSKGGSMYEYFTDISDNTKWQYGVDSKLQQGIRLLSFGKGIYDFHEIELSLKFKGANGWEYVIHDNTWGTLKEVNEEFIITWTINPDSTWPNVVSVYFTSEFWEDVGWGDPFTNDDWIYMIDIYILDTTNPTISSPSDIVFEIGQSSSITWLVFDMHPSTYEVYKDGELVYLNSWFEFDETITYNLNFLNVGEYIFKLVLTDTYKNTNSDSVKVTVIDPNNPNKSEDARVSFSGYLFPLFIIGLYIRRRKNIVEKYV